MTNLDISRKNVVSPKLTCKLNIFPQTLHIVSYRFRHAGFSLYIQDNRRCHTFAVRNKSIDVDHGVVVVTALNYYNGHKMETLHLARVGGYKIRSSGNGIDYSRMKTLGRGQGQIASVTTVTRFASFSLQVYPIKKRKKKKIIIKEKTRSRRNRESA